MGCDDLIRRRKYHGLLLIASPTDERRWMLVNGIEAWLDTELGTVPLSSHQYAPDVVHPDGAKRIVSFSAESHPAWSYRIGGGQVVFEIMNTPGRAATVLRWQLVGDKRVRLRVRLLMSGRDWHSLHHTNGAFNFTPVEQESALSWQPYEGVPPVVVSTSGEYEHSPSWFRQFLYVEERNRGLDAIEDLASPGIFSWELEDGRAAELLITTSHEWGGGVEVPEPTAQSPEPSAAYFVRRGNRDTIIAGYPWFTDWGRDTFISLPGLCVAHGNLAQAESILTSWCDVLSDGMMPNLFPSGGRTPEFNSVDASLWFVIAVRELVDESARRGYHFKSKRLTETCEEILQAYASGCRYDIHLDSDGLLAAGQPDSGLALTWMDACVDGLPVTPRVGKPVEVQALWINALIFGASWNDKWYAVAERAKLNFAIRFRNPERGWLYDVVDVDHRPGIVDTTMRPNQIFAVGGLPVALIDGKRASAIVDAVERELWTPVGLRSLAPSEPGYVGRAEGSMRERDRAYHNGAVWPWLTYAFLDAKARVSPKQSPESRMASTRKYLAAMKTHMSAAGVGHVSEIFDGDAPHEPRGCPFQAWSLAALLRASR
jgi:glycogen debranching enzyme